MVIITFLGRPDHWRRRSAAPADVYYRLGLFALPIDWHLYSYFGQMLAKMSISAIQITFC